MADNPTYRQFRSSSKVKGEKDEPASCSSKGKATKGGGGGARSTTRPAHSISSVKDRAGEFGPSPGPALPPPVEAGVDRCLVNGVEFIPLPGVNYLHDYVRIATDIKLGKLDEKKALRWLMKNDLWALVFFGFRCHTDKITANHPFVVDAAREVQFGPKTDTVDLWGREHLKSTIINEGENIQDIFNNPEERICIYSYNKSTAQVFLKNIRSHLETNEFFLWLFPDILWADTKESPQWNDDGIIVRRKGKLRECTVEAWGLTEGQPTARHFTKRVYDDIETQEIADSPSLSQKVKDRFDMSENTGSEGGRRRVIGTFYEHNAPLVYICNQKGVDGKPVWKIRKKPSTVDGKFNGAGVFLSDDRLNKLRVNRKQFRTQHLLDPTPYDEIKLPWEMIRHVTAGQIPERLMKFMVIDPALGERNDGREADSWAIWCCGVEPFINDEGGCRVYILDGFLGLAKLDEGLRHAVNIFCRNGWIMKTGVEKVGQSTFEVHVAAALRAKGRVISIENKTLEILRPGGRSKEQRITGNLMAPLKAGLIHMLDTVPSETRLNLQFQLENYGATKRDDGPDSLAYLWDLLRSYKLWKQKPEEKDEESRLDRMERRHDERESDFGTNNWMVA